MATQQQQQPLTPGSASSSISSTPVTPARQLYIPSTQPEYLTGSKLLLCSCAKCGSTSLYEWLYQIVIGKPWVPDYAQPDVQNLFSPRWKGKWSHDAPATRNSYYAAAFVREPVSRLLSAYKDKMACGLLVPRVDNSTSFGGLRYTVNPAVRRRYAEGLFRIEDRGRRLTTEPSMCWTGDAWEACEEDGCVSLDAFAEALANIHADENAHRLDAHFRPQNLVCFGDGGLAPSTWDSITAIDNALAIERLSQWLNTTLPFPSAHSTKSVELEVSAAAHRNLKRATHTERKMLAPYLNLREVGEDELEVPR